MKNLFGYFNEQMKTEITKYFDVNSTENVKNFNDFTTLSSALMKDVYYTKFKEILTILAKEHMV